MQDASIGQEETALALPPTWNVSSVVRHKANIPGVNGRGGSSSLLLTKDPHWFIPAPCQSLLLCCMLLQCLARYDGVALSKVFASLWNKPSVARHIVFLRVVIRHVVGGDGVLLGIAREVRLGFSCYGLQGGGVLGQCVLQPGRWVALQFS